VVTRRTAADAYIDGVFALIGTGALLMLRILETTIAATAASSSPATMPTTTGATPDAKRRRMIDNFVAPSADRMPTSFVRLATMNETTP
jgi:hypothetical protein